jgi:hypothetical protein
MIDNNAADYEDGRLAAADDYRQYRGYGYTVDLPVSAEFQRGYHDGWCDAASLEKE